MLIGRCSICDLVIKLAQNYRTLSYDKHPLPTVYHRVFLANVFKKKKIKPVYYFKIQMIWEK